MLQSPPFVLWSRKHPHNNKASAGEHGGDGVNWIYTEDREQNVASVATTLTLFRYMSVCLAG